MMKPPAILNPFLSGLLFYLSVSPTFGYFLPNNNPIKSNYDDTSVLLYAEIPGITNISKPIKNQLRSAKQFKAVYLNELWKGNSSSVLFNNSDYLITKKSYLAILKYKLPRLEVRTIIFPFHYFW